MTSTMFRGFWGFFKAENERICFIYSINTSGSIVVKGKFQKTRLKKLDGSTWVYLTLSSL